MIGTPASSAQAASTQVHDLASWTRCLPRFESFVDSQKPLPLAIHPAWPGVMSGSFGHAVYGLEVVDAGLTRGLLPLAYVKSWLFGRYLVSLPYLNYGGPIAADAAVEKLLLDRAISLADELDVRYLELRSEGLEDHPSYSPREDKAYMRLDLPASSGRLWEDLSAKVRNQVRKGRRSGLTVLWGAADLLDDFYAVFSRNMRDLGTPVYSRKLFAAILEAFPGRAELCVVRLAARPVAAALLLHGWDITEVPSAGCLREFNGTCANMLMYWHLLERAVQKGQSIFDFGRSTRDSNTFRFKKQWGAMPTDAGWRYYMRSGAIDALRKENPRFGRAVRLWQRLPVGLTRLIGPLIVRGIP